MVLFSPIRRLRNTKRKIINRKFDYVYLQWPEDYTNRIPQPKPFLQRLIFPEVSFSIEEFEVQINKYAKSPKGKGLIIELPLGFFMPLGLINQLHTILKPLKDNGKEIIVLAKMYTTRSYYFATFADRVFLIQGGAFDVRGSSRSILFMKSALNKMGLEFEKIAVSGFKSAFDNFARTDIAPEARENIEWLLAEETKLVSSAMQNSRNNIDYTNLINNAPYSDKDALKYGYIDGIVNADDLPSVLIPEGAKKKIKIVSFARMHKFLPIEKGKSMNEIIAVIPIVGAIIDGDSVSSPVPIPVPIPFINEEQVGDKSIIRTIRQIAKNPSVIGTILFVDSPGGSVFASETIRTALIPVVAYFNSVSASGGYYISTPADWIVSEPGCITGSIGVLMAKPSVKGFIDKNDLHVATIKSGERADWGSMYVPFSEDEKRIQQEQVDYQYQSFLSYVSENRQKNLEEIKKIAGGRVYLGTQAKLNGLVDEIGSLQQAKEKICQLAKKKPGKIPLVTFHPPKNTQSPLLIKDERKVLQALNSQYNAYLKNNLWFRDFTMDYK